MSFAIVLSRATLGMDSPPVSVEAHLANGIPSFSIVGMPELAVKESKDRVRSALLTNHFDFPAKRITINLAPADLPKSGGRFDLPIALSILAASGQLPKQALSMHEFAGELALSGELRAVKSILPFALATHQQRRRLVIPLANAREASLVRELEILPAQHLMEVYAHLVNQHALLPYVASDAPHPAPTYPNLSDVYAQPYACRALEIAAAGGHSLLLIGAPGTGKTLLAQRLRGLLPPMTDAESLATASILSVDRGYFAATQWGIRPFCAPHHTASPAALVGGGSPPRPGEISRSHHGVLFLDELPEFKRQVLETLREPMEAGCITIARAATQLTFPAQFQLIAAMNPCPCGYATSPTHSCRCTPDQVQRYQARLSGPFLDRIDMRIHMQAAQPDHLGDRVHQGEDSAKVRARVSACRQQQLALRHYINAELQGEHLEQACQLAATEQRWFKQMSQQQQLSFRAQHRVLRVARTIADLANSHGIDAAHLSEAMAYQQQLTPCNTGALS